MSPPALCWRLALLAASLSLAACSNLSPQERASQAEADLAARTPCCTDWSQASAHPLPMDVTKFLMNETADVFLQDGEKAYGVLLELPEFLKTYSITVTSITQGLQTERMVFAPRVKMMNSRFEVTRSFHESDLRTRGGNPERTVYINPSNADEKYMLIHGSGLRGSYSKKIPIQTSQAIHTGFGVVYWADGADVVATTRSSPYGEIQVQVDGLKPSTR